MVVKLIKLIKSNKALTFVEIIISVLVIVSIGLSVAGLTNNAGRIVARAAHLNQAVDFSCSMLNELLVFDYDDLDITNSSLPAQDLPATSDLKANYSGLRSYTITEKYWDGTAALPGPGDYKQLSVTTSYDDGDQHDILYQTIKRRPIL